MCSSDLVTPSSATAAPPTALSHFLKHFEEKGEKVVEQDARQCLGSFGLQGKVASDTPLVLLSGGQKVRLLSLLRNTRLTPGRRSDSRWPSLSSTLPPCCSYQLHSRTQHTR